MGIEPTSPAWKAGILAVEQHPQKIARHIIAHFLQLVNLFFKIMKEKFYHPLPLVKSNTRFLHRLLLYGLQQGLR